LLFYFFKLTYQAKPRFDISKVHKLKEEINAQSWKKLTGRPIRGAEQCPTNAPSIALCKLIQTMIGDIKGCYKTLAPNSVLANLAFPIIKGCDAYSSALNDINLIETNFSSTFCSVHIFLMLTH
jgi:hypothetical protein